MICHDIPTSSLAPQNSRLLQKLLVFGGQGKCLLLLHLEAAYFSNLEVLEAWNRSSAQTSTAEENGESIVDLLGGKSSGFWFHHFKSWPLKTMQNRCIDVPTCTKSKQKNRRFKKSPPKKNLEIHRGIHGSPGFRWEKIISRNLNLNEVHVCI